MIGAVNTYHTVGTFNTRRLLLPRRTQSGKQPRQRLPDELCGHNLLGEQNYLSEHRTLAA